MRIKPLKLHGDFSNGVFQTAKLLCFGHNLLARLMTSAKEGALTTQMLTNAQCVPYVSTKLDKAMKNWPLLKNAKFITLAQKLICSWITIKISFDQFVSWKYMLSRRIFQKSKVKKIPNNCEISQQSDHPRQSNKEMRRAQLFPAHLLSQRRDNHLFLQTETFFGTFFGLEKNCAFKKWLPCV